MSTTVSPLPLTPPLLEKLARLERELEAHAPLMIGYSGGVDSACLLAFAQRTLGERALGVIADSPSLPRQSLADALALAEKIGARVEVIRTQEMDNPQYASNPLNRCYFCKSELFTKMEQLAGERRFRAIAYGENADDPAHLRPGSQAAKEYHVLAPLKSAGLTKGEIREISRHLGLPTADAPAQPCLSSRILHGNPVTLEALAMVEKGEEWVRSLGFRIFRVRYFAGPEGAPHARVQIAPDEMGGLPNVRTEVEGGLKAIGFAEVEIDPNGYRSAA
ncbi:MAG TPA: ATP-dependent sacrificial sulfur transferase LarE [Chthoniobacteraceae bacterium]|nr:ATP-dependent sacrificial sulfur transferase LarE [Chthoniobacteraceae bacterium]